MRRVFYALVIAALVCSPVFGASRTEMANMGTFISNFTELGMYDIDIDTVTQEELVHFGVWHNYINNRSSRIKRCPKKNCPSERSSSRRGTPYGGSLPETRIFRN